MAEFLMKLHKFDPKKHGIGGWFLSEKLDGMRCFWDGGITRGKRKSEVPWANMAKDERYRDEQFCTGLWSSYGNIICAPGYWLDLLPHIFLDGELYIEQCYRQRLMSTVKKLVPDEKEWIDVKFMVYDSPSPIEFFSDRKINNVNFKKTLKGCEQFLTNNDVYLDYNSAGKSLDVILTQIEPHLRKEVAIIHKQEQLPFSTPKALSRVEEYEREVYERNGEGIVIRNPYSVWSPIRSHNIVKRKNFNDDECIVTGFTEGKGKYAGMVGALKVKWGIKYFELSGMNDSLREVGAIPVGTIVTFRYRTLTESGMPEEARFLRIRED